ncbi:unnamed protein product [Cylindrotheca closterium]|uniref:HotDog ACOT-type domain-containing protein n=1 Tax=Cylindrotheca closterium TaxID=2856 RepID=A0AAD2FSK8_9STRA|nr:unnamed protein product [Cylindrotheca closterium]
MNGVKACSRHITSRYLGARTVRQSVTRSFSSTTTSHAKTDSNHPDSLKFVSHFQSPVVQQLWVARQEAKANVTATDQSLPRVPRQSTTSVSYPFSTNEFLKESYRNPWGQVRFGKILEDLDALAGNIAFAHVQDPAMTIVTASVDKIHISKVSSLETDLVLSGKVTYVGSSSMEIRMQCRNLDDSEDEYWLEAFFTFVATDPETKRPVKIAPLKPESLLEERHFAAGKQRATARKEARKARKEASGSIGATSGKFGAIAKDLMDQAGPVINMPSISSPDKILMAQTELQNCELAQPQTRNMASQIFGGFLMRKAYELAHSTAYIFGGTLPTFYEVDEVSFGMPVNVGDLLKFNSRVMYTYTSSDKSTLRCFDGLSQTVSVEVEAWVIDPIHHSAKLSNKFYFTYAMPSDVPLRRVLPSNMEEARKIATRMQADHIQALE